MKQKFVAFLHKGPYAAAVRVALLAVVVLVALCPVSLVCAGRNRFRLPAIYWDCSSESIARQTRRYRGSAQCRIRNAAPGLGTEGFLH